MKTPFVPLAVTALTTAALLAAEPPVIVVRPVPPVSVPAPTINSTSASNQALMSQILNRLNQSRTDHAIAIATAAPRVAQPPIQPAKVEIKRSR